MRPKDRRYPKKVREIATDKNDRWRTISRLAKAAAWLLMIRIFVGILREYRWYFPADFDSNFLGGRRYTFVGSYPAAFYTHIISGPIVLAMGTFSMLTGGLARVRRYHRWAGRIGAVIVLLVMLPSGLWMSASAYTGPIAGAAFASLTIATAVAVIVTGWQARSKRYLAHRRWAIRSFILLASPLILRVIAGVLVTLDIESNTTYRLNAWLSWTIPLLVYEIWVHWLPERQHGRKKVVVALYDRHNEPAHDPVNR